MSMRFTILLLLLCLTVTTTSAGWRKVWRGIKKGGSIAARIALAKALGDTDSNKLISVMKDMDDETYQQVMDNLQSELEEKYDSSFVNLALHQLDNEVQREFSLEADFSDAIKSQ